MAADAATISAGEAKGVVVERLVKRFGGVTAVDGVSLDVRPGEFVALLGPSGSGKTTILMAIAGFEIPDAGRIAIGGEDVTDMPPNRRGLGMVFQRYTLFPHMSVAENVAFPLKMRGVGKAERLRRATEALAAVRLEGYGARLPSQLSGGQQQRVAIARAIVYRPRVLLMDEPLSALDKKLREEMQLEIKHLQRELGVTVVFVTHDQTEALTMADRVAVLDGGRLQQIGPPAELYERPATDFVAGFIGETNFLAGRPLANAPAGAEMRVALEGGTEVGAVAVAAASTGEPIRLAVRPERIVLGTSESTGLAGTVDETIYAGATTTCVVRLDQGASVRVRLPPGSDMPAGGSRVGLSWRPADARCFEARS